MFSLPINLLVMVTYLATVHFWPSEVVYLIEARGLGLCIGPGKVLLNVLETQQKCVRWVGVALLNRPALVSARKGGHVQVGAAQLACGVSYVPI